MLLRTIMFCVPLMFVAPFASAACSTPSAEAGSVFYNTDVNALQFCNGSKWLNMGLTTPTATGAACTNPTAPEGSACYNTTQNVLQFCNGDNWVVAGTQHFPSATGTACTNPASEEGTMFFNTTVGKIQFCNGDDWVNATFLDPSTFYGIQSNKLLASDGAASDNFGYSVSVDGGKVIVGANRDADNGANSGSSYIFDVNTGAHLHKLLPSDGAADDWFGSSVSIDGDKVIVGAWGDDDVADRAGAVYVFNANTGNQLYKLTASDGAETDYFGQKVSLSGNQAVVSARQSDTLGSNAGAVYLFNIDTGSQLYKLMASDGAAGDSFGWSVDIYGDKVAVGAVGDADNGSYTGSVYVFDANSGVELRKFVASDAAASDFFGASVAIYGDKLLVGAYGDDDSGSSSGSAYIFDVNTGVQLHKLTASDGAENDFFGQHVALHGSKAVVSSVGDDDNGSGSGSVYVFDVNTGSETDKLLPADGVANSYFGSSLSLLQGLFLIGARLDSQNGTSSGSVYIFE